ncbi:MAG: sugar phosphate nucleotidyltransferase [candidate division Zixibacteria bacterium]
MKPTLLILAAGIGSRYGGLKQLDTIGPSGEAIIDYSIYDAIEAGFGKVVFVIREETESAFKEMFAPRLNGRIEYAFVQQDLQDIPKSASVPDGRTKPWGTGHAVLVAESAINEPFAVINADDFYGRTAYRLLAEFLTTEHSGEVAQYSLVGYQLGKTLSDFGSVSRGVCDVSSDGYLKQVTERTKIERVNSEIVSYDSDGSQITLAGDRAVSMNMWGFKNSFFDHLKASFEQFLEKESDNLKSEFYIPTVVSKLIDSNHAKVKVLDCPESWFGVTYREDRDHAVNSIQRRIQGGAYPDNLWS